MDEFEKLTVQVPADLAKLVREAVDGDRYVVESDVVVDALREWEIRQQVRAEKLRRLRHLIDEGIASGVAPMEGGEFDRIKREGRAALAARKAAE